MSAMLEMSVTNCGSFGEKLQRKRKCQFCVQNLSHCSYAVACVTQLDTASIKDTDIAMQHFVNQDKCATIVHGMPEGGGDFTVALLCPFDKWRGEVVLIDGDEISCCATNTAA
mmetsp:Transcript_25158/g.37608  ORF Transcript_25158/g.37608 Transcript_25158/m.37608 type:complete len:113 (+) Transcript_25158:315-653(+)